MLTNIRCRHILLGRKDLCDKKLGFWRGDINGEKRGELGWRDSMVMVAPDINLGDSHHNLYREEYADESLLRVDK